MLLLTFATLNAQECHAPMAEWQNACQILMFTPGSELFDGLIHPAAGLFEEYFDADAAAMEHRNYIRMLEANGITVTNIRDVLLQIDIDTLREMAYSVLTYDTEGLSKKDAEQYGEAYKRTIIGKMSRQDLSRVLLLQPTVVLKSVDNNTGIEAVYKHTPVMNLYFTRDQSINTPRGMVVCQMNSSQRFPETRILKMVYAHLGIKPVFEVKGDGRLEGGDYIPAGNEAFIGCGMRTNIQAIKQMMEADAFGHDTVVVVNDHLLWQMEMHLDTHFGIIDRNLCTMQASRANARKGDKEYCTVDVYARQKGTKEYKLIKKNMGFVDYVTSRGYKIIKINRQDELHYANNYLTIAPRHIMAVGGQSEEYQKALKDNGVTVEWMPLENLIRGYGAAHCMTQVIERRFQP